MFLFNKTVSPFLTPIGVTLLLIALVLILLACRRNRSAFVLLVITAAGLYFASTPIVATSLSGLLERQFPPVALASSPSADAIVLLGGAIETAFPPRQARTPASPPC